MLSLYFAFFLYVLVAIVCTWTMSKRPLDLLSCILEENKRRKKRRMLFSELYFAMIVVVVDYVSKETLPRDYVSKERVPRRVYQ
jgi:hypothetical protein